MLLNTLKPRQHGRHFADDTFKRISLNENIWISIEFSLKFVRKGSINNLPALVQIMAWSHTGDKPLSEAMMIISPTHICVTRPQWVKSMPRQFQLERRRCIKQNINVKKHFFSSKCVWIWFLPWAVLVFRDTDEAVIIICTELCSERITRIQIHWELELNILHKI